MQYGFSNVKLDSDEISDVRKVDVEEKEMTAIVVTFGPVPSVILRERVDKISTCRNINRKLQAKITLPACSECR